MLTSAADSSPGPGHTAADVASACTGLQDAPAVVLARVDGTLVDRVHGNYKHKGVYVELDQLVGRVIAGIEMV